MIIDLFAGMGGVAEGLRSLGLREVGVELDATACATRRAAGHRTVRADVTTLAPWRLRGRVEGIWASPPCQDWSRAGKRQGLATERGRLVYEPLRWVEYARPEWVALEQVEDVLEVWRELAWRMRAWGYETWVGVLNAADFGVPQTRRRAILMASRVRKVAPPAHTHSDQRRGGSLLGLPPWVSMAEALGWGFDDTGAKTLAGHRSPRWLYPAGEGTGRVVVRTGNNGRVKGGAYTDWRDTHAPYERPIDRPAPTLEAGSGSKWTLHMGNNTGSGAVPRPGDQPARTLDSRVDQWSWTRPATTVQHTARVAKPGHRDREGGERQFEQAIRITLAEALVLQGFRPDYPAQGTKTKRFEQVGNAVPPPLAAAIVAALTERSRAVVA